VPEEDSSQRVQHMDDLKVALAEAKEETVDTHLVAISPIPMCAFVGPVKSMWKTRNRDLAPRGGFAWDIAQAG
jgi:hypothetical protein